MKNRDYSWHNALQPPLSTIILYWWSTGPVTTAICKNINSQLFHDVSSASGVIQNNVDQIDQYQKRNKAQQSLAQDCGYSTLNHGMEA